MAMYIEKKNDKINYLKGLIRLAKADGIIVDEEVEYFNIAEVGMKLDEDSIAKINECWNSSKKISVEFSTKITAMFFIQEAIQLCEVDGSYDEAEKNEIRNLAEELGISEEKIVAIEKWVQTGIVWRQQGEALIKAFSED